MAYLDVFIGPVPTVKMDEYRAYAKTMGALTVQAGAISAIACRGADFPGGMVKSLASAVKLEPGETLVSRVVTWASKEAHGAGWAEMMKSPDMPANPPFDRSRVYYGGFETLEDS